MSVQKLTPLRLIEALDTKVIKPENLSAHQRKVLVKYFMENQSDITNAVLGQMIGITDGQVGRLKKELIKRAVWEIEEIDIKMLAAALLKKKQEYQKKAAKAGNYSLAWQIEKDYIEKMQELGFVYKAPAVVDLNVVQTNFQIQIKELYRELGVPTREQFIALLEAARGNGGDGRRLIEQTAASRKTDTATVDRGASRKRP